MQPQRTTPRALPVQPSRPGRSRWILSSIGLALATLGFLTLPRWCERRERTKYKAALRAREEDLVRWKGWLEVGSCLRHDDGARWLAALDKLAGEPSTDALPDTAQDPLVDGKCLASLAPLEADPALPAEAQTAVRDWIAADHALDQPASKSPDQLRRLLGARDRVREQVRGKVLPPVNAAIRKVQDRHAGKHNYVWWRIELGFLLEGVLDTGVEAHDAGRDIAGAVATPLHNLQGKLQEANDVGIRNMPELDVLARATGDAAWPALQAVEDNGAWNQLEHDNFVFGVMPSEPQGCGIDQE